MRDISPEKTTMRDFLHKPDACEEGFRWAMAECASLSQVWDTAKPEWLIWLATREDVLSARDQRLFACWSVRQVWPLLIDERSRNAVEVSERFARGQASNTDLAAARAAASDAARAARAAARADAWAAARADASDAAWAAARVAQCSIIRSVFENPFQGGTQ